MWLTRKQFREGVFKRDIMLTILFNTVVSVSAGLFLVHYKELRENYIKKKKFMVLKLKMPKLFTRLAEEEDICNFIISRGNEKKNCKYCFRIGEQDIENLEEKVNLLDGFGYIKKSNPSPLSDPVGVISAGRIYTMTGDFMDMLKKYRGKW